MGVVEGEGRRGMRREDQARGTGIEQSDFALTNKISFMGVEVLST